MKTGIKTALVPKIRAVSATAVMIACLGVVAGSAKAVAASNDDALWYPGIHSTPYGDFLAGRFAESHFDAALASRLLSRTLRYLPNDPGLLRQTLHQMISAGHMEKAVPLARRYLKLQPKNVMASLLLAVDDVRNKKLSDARLKLKVIPNRGLGSYFVPLVLAWVQAGEGDGKAAIKTLAPLGKRQGLGVIHTLHSALILDLVGEPKRAAPFFEKLATGKEHQRFVLLAGAFFERQGDSERAEKIYRAALVGEPGSRLMEQALARLKKGEKPAQMITGAGDGVAEALWNLAMLLNQDRIQEIAVMLTRMALHLRPQFAVAQILLGDIFETVDRYGDAVKTYDGVDVKHPLAWRASLRAALVFDRMGKTDEAIKRLTAMVNEKNDRTDALIARGDLLRFKKRYVEAIKDYDKVLVRIGPGKHPKWTLYYSRGIAHERSKQWMRAEKDFLTALKMSPDQPFVLNYLGYSWVEKKMRLDKALGMIEKAVKARPRDGFIIDSLGWAHYQLGTFSKAVTYLERAVMLSSDDAAINDHLGDAYWRVGRRVEARFQWRRALNFGPEPDQVLKIKKKLDNGLGATEEKRKASRSIGSGAQGAPDIGKGASAPRGG
ncbi:MAG: tetratricopeptide repeat protein [Rhodospirillales bacterium]|nr:tetratricopeptide repeat protein [Rhodospirillales bacterium]